MAFEIQNSGNLSGDDLSSPYTFTFSENVFAFMVGIQNFRVSFSDQDAHDHSVQTFSIALSAQPGSSGGFSSNQVVVTPSISFHDDDNHDLDADNSQLGISCLALMENDLNGSVGNIASIDSGSASSSEGMSSNAAVWAVVSGFDFDYGDQDHFVKDFSLSLDVTKNTTDNTFTVTPTGVMDDASDNAATVTAAAGYIGYAGIDNSNLMIVSKQYGATTDPQTIEFGQAISGVAVFVTGWKLSFADGDDHQIAQISVSCDDIEVDKDSGTVTLHPALGPSMNDQDDHYADTSSYATYLVIATAAS